MFLKWFKSIREIFFIIKNLTIIPIINIFNTQFKLIIFFININNLCINLIFYFYIIINIFNITTRDF